MLVKKTKIASALTGIILLLSSTVFSQLSGNYTINSAAVTSGTNFQNFNDLASVLASNGVIGNVTVDVVAGSGPYIEQVNFTTIPGSGPAAVITINGNGNVITSPAEILSNVPPSNPNRHIIRLTNVSYFTINNLKVNMVPTPSNPAFMGIHLFSNAAPVSHITINRVNIDMGTATSTLVGGIIASGSQTSFLTGGNFSNLTFSNDTTTGGGYGAVMYGLTATPVLNSVISGNVFNGTNSNGIYVHTTNDLIVRNNALNFNASNGIQLAGAANLRAVVEKNTVSATNPTTTGNLSGILIFGNTAGANTNKVVNNLVWKMNAPLATIYGLEARSTGAEFYYNTVILDDATATGTRSIGFLESSANSGTILKNNIFYIIRPSSNYGTALALTSTSVVTTAVPSDDNVFFLAGGNNHLAVRQGLTGANPPTNTYSSLTDWRTASSQDLNSFETNPFFTPGTAIPTSAIINNQAVSIAGVTTDITGATRSATPDPGVYEFVPAVNDAAVTRFIPPTAPFCGGTLNVQFELTNSGTDPLTSATINWTVNGVAQIPVNWTGTVASGASTIVSLGGTPVNGTTTYQLSATVSDPNGQPDANAANNSFTYSGFRTGMSGSFTINSGAPVSAFNYQTFQSIADDLSVYGVCGAVNIAVMNGPYSAQVVFDSIPGSSSDNSVTLNGNNQLLSFATATSGNDHVLKLNNVDYFSVNQLQVRSTDANNGRPVFITNGSSYITINRCIVEASKTVAGSTAFGIIASGTSYLLDGSFTNNLVITGNTVIGGYVGIQITGEDPGLVDFVTIADNILLDQYAFGIQAYGIKDADITRNDISRPTRTNSTTYYGIGMSFRSNGFRIDKNRIHDLQNSGMTLSHLAGGITISGTTIAPSTGTISNNLIYNFTNTSTQYGINDVSWGTQSNVSIYHNTIALNYSDMTGSATTSVISLNPTQAPTGTHNIRNNVFYISRGGTGTKRMIDVPTATTVFSSNHNVFWFATSTGTIQQGRVGATTYADFASWQASGRDANSVNLDPQAADTTNDNYRPSNASIRGAVLATSQVGGITTDITNAVRSGNPDPGAYEFAGILPVRFEYFTGKNKNGTNQLQWKTATEQNNKGFELQHSRNGVQFTTITFINSKAPDGNSSLALDYSFDDLTPMAGDNYYRLKQVDRNDRFEYSGIVRIRNEKGRIIVLGPIHPNPVKASLKTIITAGVDAEVNVLVTDLAGRILLQKAVRLAAGNNTLDLPVSQLAAGTYLLKTSSSSFAESTVQKFIKQ